MYTLAKCRKYFPGFGLPGFKADALRLYENVCQAVAGDDLTELRQVGCTAVLASSQTLPCAEAVRGANAS
jgi:large subunit ribosomal protein L45